MVGEITTVCLCIIRVIQSNGTSAGELYGVMRRKDNERICPIFISFFPIRIQTIIEHFFS